MLKIKINGIEVENLVDTGNNNCTKTWHLGLSLQVVNVQLLGIRTLSQVKQRKDRSRVWCKKDR